MSIRFLKFARDNEQGSSPPDASPTESGMIADDAHGADFRPTVTPNRRLRNWILLANVLAWVATIVAIRWLLF